MSKTKITYFKDTNIIHTKITFIDGGMTLHGEWYKNGQKKQMYYVGKYTGKIGEEIYWDINGKILCKYFHLNGLSTKI